MMGIDILTLREQYITTLIKKESSIEDYAPSSEIKNSLIERITEKYPRRPGDFRLRTYMSFVNNRDQKLNFNFLDTEGLNSTYSFDILNKRSNISINTTKKVISEFTSQIKRTMEFRDKVKSDLGGEPALSDSDYKSLLQSIPKETLKQMDESGHSFTNREAMVMNYKTISHYTAILFQGARDCIVCAHEEKDSGKVILDHAFSFNNWGR